MPEPSARDFAGYGGRPPRVRWPDGARVALSVLVNLEAAAEYTFEEDGRNEGAGEWVTGLGDGVCDRSTQSVFEYETRAGFWRVMGLFDEHAVPVTVNASALAVERNPAIAGYLRDASHEVSCHGWRWEEPWTLTREQEAEHMARALDSLERTTGQRPRGWASRLMQSEHTRALLVEQGVAYDSDALDDDLPHFVPVGDAEHLVLPLSFTYNDGQYVLNGVDPAGFLAYLKLGLGELLRESAERPKMMTVALHPRWSGQAARTAVLRAFLEHAKAQDGVWFAQRIEIADWWYGHHDGFER
ncbi:MAG TPA: polysaccharide deacetylase family protein [Conexibacter sp.]|nr:polysaccharide deacetylase family protein [Conexibacter sp.]